MNLDDAVHFVYAAIVNSFSEVNEERIKAENTLKACESQAGCGMVLVSLLADRQLPPMHRQMAGVLLRHYIEQQWSNDGMCSEEVRHRIRQCLPDLLVDNDSKICTMVGMCIGVIARTDFPLHWPNLLSQLLEFVNSGDERTVEAGLWALSLVAEHLLEDQIMVVVRQLFPELLRLSRMPSSSQSMRSRSLRIYRITMRAFITITSITPYERVIEQLLLPTLDDWLWLMTAVLSAPIHHDVLDTQYGLRQEALKSVKTLVEMFPDVMATRVPALLPTLWSFLMQAVDMYDQSCVLSDDVVAAPQFDANGEEVSLPAHLAQLLEFMATLLQGDAAGLFESKMGEMVYAVLTYQQITQYEMAIWTNDPDEFLRWEDVEYHAAADAVRTSAQELLRFVLEKFPPQIIFRAVADACQTRMAEASQLKAAGHVYWWKRLESVLFALGTLADCAESGGGGGFGDGDDDEEFGMLMNGDDNNDSNHHHHHDHNDNQYAFDYDWASVMTEVVFPCVDLSTNTTTTTTATNAPNNSAMIAAATCEDYLRARAVWFISHAIVLASTDAQVLHHGLAATVKCLHPSVGIATRLSATRSFGRLCMILQPSAVLPHLAEALNQIAALMMHSSSETLITQLQTFLFMLDVDNEVTASVANATIPLMLQAWRSNATNHEVIMLVTDAFVLMAQNPRNLRALQETVVPVLLSVLTHAKDQEVLVVEAALNLISQFLLACERHQCLPDSNMYLQALPATLSLVLTSDSTDVVERGTKLLRDFIRVSPDAVTAARFSNNNNNNNTSTSSALELVCRSLARLLDPFFDENAAWHAGDLLAQLLVSYGNVLDAQVTMELLVLAIVRLNVVHFSGIKHNLIRCFARLFQQRGVQLLDLLHALPVIQVPEVPSFAERYQSKVESLMYPRPANLTVHPVHALDSLFRVWLSSVTDLSGYAERLSVVALTDMLSWQDARLQPIYSHILCALLSVWDKHQQIANMPPPQHSPTFADADAFFGGDDGGGAGQYLYLSDLLALGGSGDDENGGGGGGDGSGTGGDDDDGEKVDERINSIDVMSFVHEFIVTNQQHYSSNQFKLGDEDRAILHQLLSSSS